VQDRFKNWTSQPYPDQSKAFLNAYWDELSGDAETVWSWCNQFIELDHEKGKEGHDLDEFNAHRFLEKNGETKTVKQMRDELREIDMDFNKRMAIIEFLLWRFRKEIPDFVNRPQGGNVEELQHAQQALNIAREALEASRVAENELKTALNELQLQEESYNQKTEQLKAKSEDQSLGVVQRNKARNELAQHQSQDPLPLRQAKITTEAATKKAERARANAESKFQEAENFLHEVRSRGDGAGGQGALWWLERELEEVKKYMPRGGSRRN
jgi:hypothetical protein